MAIKQRQQFVNCTVQSHPGLSLCLPPISTWKSQLLNMTAFLTTRDPVPYQFWLIRHQEVHRKYEPIFFQSKRRNPYVRKWRRTKETLDEGERGEWKSGLRLSIQKMKLMASGPITSWQIDGETMEKVMDFIFLDSKITADGDCSHEITKCCLLEEKIWTT